MWRDEIDNASQCLQLWQGKIDIHFVQLRRDEIDNVSQCLQLWQGKIEIQLLHMRRGETETHMVKYDITFFNGSRVAREIFTPCS